MDRRHGQDRHGASAVCGGPAHGLSRGRIQPGGVLRLGLVTSPRTARPGGVGLPGRCGPGSKSTWLLYHIRAWHSSFEGGSPVLMADVPRHRLNTLYASIGDSLDYGCLAFLVALIGWAALMRRDGPRNDP